MHYAQTLLAITTSIMATVRFEKKKKRRNSDTNVGCVCLCLHRARGTSFLIHGALLLTTALLDDSQDQGRRIVTAFSKCLADSRLDILGRVDQVPNHDSLYYSIFVYTTRYSWILSNRLGLGGKVRSIKGQGLEWVMDVTSHVSPPTVAANHTVIKFAAPDPVDLGCSGEDAVLST